VIAGFKDYQIKYYTGFKANKKQQQMVIQKSDERFYNLYNKSRKINNIKIITGSRTKLN
jgi:hypothetical protein